MLKLRGKVELYVFKVLLGHGQHISAVGQEDIASVPVLGHILVFAILEVLQFLLIPGVA